MRTVIGKNKKKKVYAGLSAFVLVIAFAFSLLSGIVADRITNNIEDEKSSSVSQSADWTGTLGQKGTNTEYNLTSSSTATELDGSTFTYYLYPGNVTSDVFKVNIGRYYWDPMPSTDIISLFQQYVPESTVTHPFKFYSRITGVTEGVLHYQNPSSADAKWCSLKFVFYVRGSIHAYDPDNSPRQKNYTYEYIMSGSSASLSLSNLAESPTNTPMKIIAGSVFYPVAVDASPYSIFDIGLNMTITTSVGLNYDEGADAVSVTMRSSNYRSFGVEFLVLDQRGYIGLVNCLLYQSLDGTANKGKGQGLTTKVETRTSTTDGKSVTGYNTIAKTYDSAPSGMIRSEIMSSKMSVHSSASNNYFHTLNTTGFKASWTTSSTSTAVTSAGEGGTYTAQTTIAPESVPTSGKYRASSFDMVLQQNTQCLRYRSQQRRLYDSACNSYYYTSDDSTVSYVQHIAQVGPYSCTFIYDNYYYYDGSSYQYRMRCSNSSHSSWPGVTYYRTSYVSSVTTTRSNHYLAGCAYQNPTAAVYSNETAYANTNTVPFYFSTDTADAASIKSKADGTNSNARTFNTSTRIELPLSAFVDNPASDGVEFDAIYAYDKAYMSCGLFKKGDVPHILIAPLRNTSTDSPKYLVVSVSRKIGTGADTKIVRRLVSMRINIVSMVGERDPILKTNQAPVTRATANNGIDPIEESRLKELLTFTGVKHPTSDTSNANTALYASGYSSQKTFHVGQSYVDGVYSIDEYSIAEDNDPKDTLYFSKDSTNVVFDDSTGKVKTNAINYLSVSYVGVEPYQDIVLTLKKPREKTTYYLKVFDSPYADFGMIPIEVTCYDYAPEFTNSFKSTYSTAIPASKDILISASTITRTTNGIINMTPGSDKSNYAAISVLTSDDPLNANYYKNGTEKNSRNENKLIANDILGTGKHQYFEDRDWYGKEVGSSLDKLTISVKDAESHSEFFNVVYPDSAKIASENGLTWEGAQTVVFYAKKMVFEREVTLILHDGYSNTLYANRKDGAGNIIASTQNGKDVEITVRITIENTPVSAKYNTISNVLSNSDAKLRLYANQEVFIEGSQLGYDFDNSGIYIKSATTQIVSIIDGESNVPIGDLSSDMPTGDWGYGGYVKTRYESRGAYIEVEAMQDGRLRIKGLAKSEGLVDSPYYSKNKANNSGDFALLIELADNTNGLNEINSTFFNERSIWVVLDIRVLNSTPIAKTENLSFEGTSGSILDISSASLASDNDIGIDKPNFTINGKVHIPDSLYIGLRPDTSGFSAMTVQERQERAIEQLKINNRSIEHLVRFYFEENDNYLSLLHIELLKYSGSPINVFIPVFDTGGYRTGVSAPVSAQTVSAETGLEVMVMLTVNIGNANPVRRPTRVPGGTTPGQSTLHAKIYINADYTGKSSFIEDTAGIKNYKDHRTLNAEQNGYIFSDNKTINNVFRVSPYDLVSDPDLQDDLRAMDYDTNRRAWVAGQGLNAYPKIRDDDFAAYTDGRTIDDGAFGTGAPQIAGMDELRFVPFDSASDEYPLVSGTGNLVRAKGLNKSVDEPYVRISFTGPNCIAIEGRLRTAESNTGYVTLMMQVTDTFNNERIELYFDVYVLNSKPIQNEGATPGYWGNAPLQMQVNPDDESTFSQSAINSPGSKIAPTQYPNEIKINKDSELIVNSGKLFSDPDRAGSSYDKLSFHPSDFILVKNERGNGITESLNKPSAPVTANILTTEYVRAIAYDASVMTIYALRSTYNVSNPVPGGPNQAWHNYIWLGFKVLDDYALQVQTSNYMWIMIEVANSAPILKTEFKTYTISQEVAQSKPLTFAIAGKSDTIQYKYEEAYDNGMQGVSTRNFSVSSTANPLYVPVMDHDGDSLKLTSDDVYTKYSITGSEQQREGDDYGISDAYTTTDGDDWFFVLTFIKNNSRIQLTLIVTDGSKTVRLVMEFLLIATPLKYPLRESGGSLDVAVVADGTSQSPVTFDAITKVDLYDLVRLADDPYPSSEAKEGAGFVRLIENKRIDPNGIMPSRTTASTSPDYPYVQAGLQLKAKNSSIYIDPLDAKYIHIYGGEYKGDNPPENIVPNQTADKTRMIYIRGLQRTPRPINITIWYHVWDGTGFGTGGQVIEHQLVVSVMVRNSAVNVADGTDNTLTLRVASDPLKITTTAPPNDGSIQVKFSDADQLDKHYINASSFFVQNDGTTQNIVLNGNTSKVDAGSKYNNVHISSGGAPYSFTDYFDILYRETDGSYTTLTEDMFRNPQPSGGPDYINAGKRKYDSTEYYIRPKKKTTELPGEVFELTFLMYDDYEDTSQRTSQFGYKRDTETTDKQLQRSDRIIDQEQLFSGYYSKKRVAVTYPEEADKDTKVWAIGDDINGYTVVAQSTSNAQQKFIWELLGDGSHDPSKAGLFVCWDESGTPDDISGMVTRKLVTVKVKIENNPIAARQTVYSAMAGLGNDSSDNVSFYLANLIRDPDMYVFHLSNSKTCKCNTCKTFVGSSTVEKVKGYSQMEVESVDFQGNIIKTLTDDYSAANYTDYTPSDGYDIIQAVEITTNDAVNTITFANSPGSQDIYVPTNGKYVYTNPNSAPHYVDIELGHYVFNANHGEYFNKPLDQIYSGQFQKITFSFMARPPATQTLTLKIHDGNEDGTPFTSTNINVNLSFKNKAPIQLTTEPEENQFTGTPSPSNPALLIELNVGESLRFDLRPTESLKASRYTLPTLSEQDKKGLGTGINTASAFKGYLRPAMDFEAQYLNNPLKQNVTNTTITGLQAEIAASTLYFPELDDGNISSFELKYKDNLTITQGKNVQQKNKNVFTSFEILAIGAVSDGSLLEFSFLVSDDENENSTVRCTYYIRIISTPPELKKGTVGAVADTELSKGLIGIKLNETKTIDINNYVIDSDNKGKETSEHIDKLSVLNNPLSFENKNNNPDVDVSVFNNYLFDGQPKYKDSDSLEPTYGARKEYTGNSPFLLGIRDNNGIDYTYSNSISNSYFSIQLQNSTTISIKVNTLYGNDIMGKDTDTMLKKAEFRLVFLVVDKSNCFVEVELRFTIINDSVTNANESNTAYDRIEIDSAGATNNAVSTINLSNYVKGPGGVGNDIDFNDSNMQYSVSIYEGPRTYNDGVEDITISELESNLTDLTAIKERFGTGTEKKALATYDAYMPSPFTYNLPSDVSHIYNRYFDIHSAEGINRGKTISLIARMRTPIKDQLLDEGIKIIIVFTKNTLVINAQNEIELVKSNVVIRLRVVVKNSAPELIKGNQITKVDGGTYGEMSTIVLTAAGDTEDPNVLASKEYRVKLFDYENASATKPLMYDPDGDGLAIRLTDIDLVEDVPEFYKKGSTAKGSSALYIRYDENTQELVFLAYKKMPGPNHQATYTLQIPVHDTHEVNDQQQKTTMLYIPITIANSRPVVKQSEYVFTIYTDEKGDLNGYGKPGTKDGETRIDIADLIEDDDLKYMPSTETYTFSSKDFTTILNNPDGLKLYNSKLSYDCVVHLTSTTDQKTFIINAKSIIRGAYPREELTAYITDSSGDQSIAQIKFKFVIGNSAPKVASPQPSINVVGGMKEVVDGAEKSYAPREYPIFLNEEDHKTYFREKLYAQQPDLPVQLSNNQITQDEIDELLPQYTKIASDINGDELRYNSILEDFSVVNLAVYDDTLEIDFTTESPQDREERSKALDPIIQLEDYEEEGNDRFKNKAFILRPYGDFYGVLELTIRIYDDDISKEGTRFVDAKITVNVAKDPMLLETNEKIPYEMYNRKTASVRPEDFYKSDYMIAGYEFVPDSMRVIGSSGEEKDPNVEDQNATILIARNAKTNLEEIKAMRAGEAVVRITLRIGYEDFRIDYTIIVLQNNMPEQKTTLIKTIKENLITDGAWGKDVLYHVEYVNDLFNDFEGDELKIVSVSSSRKMIVEPKIGRDDDNNPVKLVLKCYASGTAEITIKVQDDIAAYDYKIQYVNEDLEPLSFFASILSEVSSNYKFYGLILLAVVIIALIVVSRIRAIMRKRKLRANMQALLQHEMEMEQQYMQLAQQQMFNMLPPSASMPNNMLLGATGFDFGSNNMMLNSAPGQGMISDNMLLGGGADFPQGNDMLQLGAGMSDAGENEFYN